MTQEQYMKLVARLEKTARSQPGVYRFKVTFLAYLGYFYLFLVLAGTCALIYFLGRYIYDGLTGDSFFSVHMLKLLLPLGLFVLVLLRSLWVRIPEPEGMELRRDQAVPLFQTIDRLRAEMKVPKFHRVILNDEYNAAVMQVPRLGIFGWQKNFLILGLPLMLTLNPEEFRAVLAHELGHISGAHGRFGSWVYRIHQTWEQIWDALVEQENLGSFVLLTFYRWYIPYFAAYTFILRRAHEYEADRAAALLTGARVYAESLTRVHFMGHVFALRLQPPLSREQAESVLNAVKAEKSDWVDEHPSISERLGRIRQEIEMPKPFAESAAEKFLGHKLVSLAHSLGFRTA